MSKHNSTDTDAWCLSSLAPIVPEGFRLISGFIGYAVNNFGVVISLRQARGKEWRELKPEPNKDGYLVIRLSMSTYGGENYRRLVPLLISRVVMITFGSPQPPDKPLVLHDDNNKINNYIDNLKWGDIVDNSNDMGRHDVRARGERQHLSKLTDKDIPDIIQLHKSGMSLTAIGKKYGVTTRTISCAVKRTTWKHLKLVSI